MSFVNDMQATISFYNKPGFSVTNSVESPEGDLVWAMMDHGDVTLMVQTFTSIDNMLSQIQTHGRRVAVAIYQYDRNPRILSKAKK